jgi:hypothetical protein
VFNGAGVKMLARLYNEHRQIVVLVKKLINMIDPENPPELADLARVRSELAACSDLHLLTEAKFIAEVLGRRDDQLAQILYERYKSEMLEIQIALSAHMGRWNPTTIRSDWHGYQRGVRDQLAIGIERMKWEERVVFPVVLELDPVRSGQAWQPKSSANTPARVLAG